jgi:hypothetical protein
MNSQMNSGRYEVLLLVSLAILTATVIGTLVSVSARIQIVA